MGVVRRSRDRRRTALLVLALAGVSPAAGLPTAAAPSSPSTPAPTVAAPATATVTGTAAAPTSGEGPQGYPRQATVQVPPPVGSDASVRLGLTAYHEIAPRLNALQARSDRVSVEVVGDTVTGRELYLVTLTAPESAQEAGRQERMRQRIVDQPAEAATDPTLLRDYKTPVFLAANVHGNEWEGTDAALALVEDYAQSNDPDVRTVLESTRVHLLVSANPDGRHDNTRRNVSGFDLNRDFVTATQPEVVAVRDALVRAQPTVVLDLHGYVNGTLVEPTTPPHGEYYEYDLVLEHAYPLGLAVEDAVLGLGLSEQADGVRAPQLPLRDWTQGWDGWPPIFLPQYAALHGAVAHTVELPLRVNNAEYREQDTAELRRRAVVNTTVARAAMAAAVDYAAQHRRELLTTQIEVFRRGAAGEPQRPVTFSRLPHAGPEDVYLTDYPRAYVIPTGSGQRSPAAAARLVDHLLANDVTVVRSRRPLTVAGTTYPAGSYVVDLHQGKRAVAQALLGPGTDLSERVPEMYDIAGWSHGLLWGADVVSVPAGSPLPAVGGSVQSADPTGQVSASGDLVLQMQDPADVAAVNSLLNAGVPVRWLDSGAALVPAVDRPSAQQVAADFGVRLDAAGPDAAGVALEALTVAAAAAPEERWALEEMGFDVTAVDPAVLNDGFDWAEVDALYVSEGLPWAELDPTARAGLTAYLDGGGGLVARGAHGAALNDATDLLEVSAVEGRADANGVVAVDSTDSPVAADAPEHAFVYSPVWFTELGAQVRVDQRYAVDGPLVSGHWRADAAGRGGPLDAQGQPVVVSGVDEDGAAVVLLGSQPLFRAHPKGQYALVARALIWSSVEGR